jgi:hypothetical protein
VKVAEVDLAAFGAVRPVGQRGECGLDVGCGFSGELR